MRKAGSQKGNRRGFSIRTLLIVLVMLCGHAALASHQALHESSAELSCATCLASDACDYLLSNNDACPSPKIVHVTAETADRRAPANRTAFHATIRAPPLTTS